MRNLLGLHQAPGGRGWCSHGDRAHGRQLFPEGPLTGPGQFAAALAGTVRGGLVSTVFEPNVGVVHDLPRSIGRHAGHEEDGVFEGQAADLVGGEKGACSCSLSLTLRKKPRLE